MAFTNWLASKLPDRALLQEAQKRAFVIGAGVVNPADETFGHDTSMFSPEEYGNYIATSNGVYACVTQRAQYLASLPLKFYRVKPGGEKVEVTSGKLVELMTKVNPFWSGNRLLQMTEMARCLWGQSFWFLERGETGKQPPQEIWWGRPDRVSVVPDRVNYLKGFFYNPLTGTQALPYMPGEVIWSRFPNPIDEYSGLSPLAAARLSADYATDALKSNRNLFKNGIMSGGVICPKGDNLFDQTKSQEIEKVLERRFQGVDKAHRWSVFTFDVEAKSFGFNPKEAEFLGGLAWSLEDIARTYKWPLDLIGGTQRTYANVSEARKAAWTGCVLPEAAEIAADMTEQLLPMFNEADLAEFDSSGIPELQEDKHTSWQMWGDQIVKGAKTINQYRESIGDEPVPWGDAWWASPALAPITSAELPEPETTPPTEQDNQDQSDQDMPDETMQQSGNAQHKRAIVFGSPEHETISARATQRVEKGQKQIQRMAVALFERQRASVISRLEKSGRTAEQVASDPFDMAQWVKEFRTAARPVLKGVMADAVKDAFEGTGITFSFDINKPETARFIEQRAQRFAKQVNETTWNDLKASLSEGFNAGEGVEKLKERIESIMGDKIRSSSETIARTESLGATSGGDLMAWRDSGVVKGKRWISAFALRSRQSHMDAHNQTVGLDEDFSIGGVTMSAPGLSGVADEDINCLCTMVPEVEGA